MKRQASIECYRVLLMVGICILHANTVASAHSHCLEFILTPCVNGFVFISGWYGIRFKWRKFFSIVSTAIYAGCVAVLLAYLFAPELLSCTKDCFKLLRHIFVGQWFFMAYLVLMLLSPALNSLVDLVSYSDSRRLILSALLVLLLWNWIPSLPVLNRIIETPPGFGSYTPLSLILTYLFAAFCRKLGWLDILSLEISFFAIVVIGVVLSMGGRWGLADYSSPVAMAFAALIFNAFRYMKISSISWGWVAPSLFTMALLQS